MTPAAECDRFDLDAVLGGLLGQNRGDGDPGPGPGAVGGEFQGAAVGIDDPHPAGLAVQRACPNFVLAGERALTGWELMLRPRLGMVIDFF
jgi:hypothetical protein